MKDSRFRSVVKGLTWRVIASGTTMSVAYFLTGDMHIVMATGAIDVVAKLLFYYGHERLWGRVAWGRAAMPVGKKNQKKR